MRIEWYADDTDTIGSRGAKIPDVFLFGGICIESQEAQRLRHAIEDVKQQHGSARAPVKWNFKDLKRDYHEADLDELYQRRLETSKEWRRDILQASLDFDYSILVSCLESYSTKRSMIKKHKNDFARYAFSNALQRLGLHVDQAEATTCHVILDWPASSKPGPYSLEYVHAYNYGTTADGSSYASGALRDLGFLDAPSFAVMKNSTLLQLADLVVGAVRELIQFAIKNSGPNLGVELTKAIRSKFYGAPSSIVGHGIVVSGKDGFRQTIQACIDSELS